MKTILSLVIILTASIILSACSDSPVSPNNLSLTDDPGSCTMGVSYPLITGKRDTVGSVLVKNDANYISITYKVNGTRTLEKIHTWTGTNLDHMPVNPAGLPVAGQFCHSVSGFCGHANGVKQYTVRIPLSTLGITNVNLSCENMIYVFPNAQIKGGGNTENAWGGNIGMYVSQPGKSYYYSKYSLCCGEIEIQ